MVRDSDEGLYVHQFEAMKSLMIVRLPAESGVEELARSLEQEIHRIEAKFSRYRPDSVVSIINGTAGQAVEVDDETARLLSFAGEAYRISGGRFDITSGVLRRVWDFKARRVPSEEALRKILPLIGWPKVEVSGSSVFLPKGMEIDFGGIGKEYACDRAAALCLTAGAKNALINLGGDVWALGSHPSGRSWRVGIPHPRLKDQIVCSLDVENSAVATSGDYERYFEAGGRRYHHILSPITGFPVNGPASVTVAGASCLGAGIATTTAMLMTDQEAALFLAGQRYLLVSAAGKVSVGS